MATYSTIFSNNSAYTLYLDVTEASWDILTNSSVVNYTLRAHSDKALQYGSWDYNSGDTQYRVYINGTLVASGYKTYDFRNYKDLTVASGSTTVVHDDDGSKACPVSASYCGSGSPIGSASISKTFTLTTIPRASDLTCNSPAVMGTTESVTVTQKSASFSHILYYSTDNGTTWTEIGRDTATKTYSWTLPDISNSLPNTDTATFNLKCETFLNGTYDDTPLESTLAVIAEVPSGYVPTVTIGTITEGNSDVPNGWPFIVGHSKPTIPTTFTGSHNSTVVSRSVALNGETLTSTSAVEPVSLTATRTLSVATTPVTVTVTDSRGRTGTATTNITAVAYSAPTVQIDCTRCQSDGTIDPLGTYVLVLAKWSWTSVGSPELNSADIDIYIDGTLDTTYTTTTNAQNTLTQIAILSGFQITNQYNITVTISDELVSSTVSQLVTKAQMPLSLFDDGNDIGVTIGRMATQGGLNNWLDLGLVTGKNVNLYDANAQVIDTMTTDDLFSGGGGSTKFIKGTPINLYDTDGTTVLYSRNPENLVFYDGQEGSQVASNFIYANPTADVTLSTSYINITNLKATNSKGNGFEISSGQIKCNKNGRVRVIVVGFVYASGGRDYYQAIGKNGVNQNWGVIYSANYSNHITNTMILDVVEGDIINVRAYATSSGATYRSASQIICEYIEDYYITNNISYTANTKYELGEHVIGEWLGRPLYRKIITGSNSAQSFTVGLGTSNIANWVTCEVKLLRAGNYNQNTNIGGYWNASADYFSWYLSTPNSNQLTIRGGSDWPKRPYDYAIILEYTKTTD